MEPEAIRIAFLFAFLTVAAYFDVFNRKNVPVAIPYAMIALGILLNLYSLDFSELVSSATVSLLIITVGYIIYRAGQIGGADVLIFTGIALLMPMQPVSLYPLVPVAKAFTYPFVFSVFLVSGFIALIALAFKYVPFVLRGLAAGKVRIHPLKAIPAILVCGAYIASVYVLAMLGIITGVQGAFISALAILAGFLTLFKDEISAAMVEWVGISEIDDEDVIAIHLLKPALVSRLDLQPVLTRPELEKLKSSKLKKFPIFKGMPAFLPYVLLAALFLLLFGDPIAMLIA